ncbi:STAS domain-containing protein [Nocardia sp. CWNU-33]|uniref:STAS domain-containing protein n=1 Tax=Nocardia sp. CWNU-33 TaxID=3392117 RepID=UPI00398F765C
MIHKAGRMDAEIEKHDKYGPVLVVRGEVDARTAPGLVIALDRVLHDHPARVLVDLSGISFMDSAGLQPLIDANSLAGPDTVFAVIATGAAARPLRLTGLDSILAIYPHRAMALARTTAVLTPPS